uniref:Serine/threonine-protein kinase PkaA-like n=1 Tax=Nicotiana tabacum TaxID=4097 RepID=A0A1S3XV76_TOBAC|nr:PREDICTED: serine/threonine-protein kinase PkaA-like [Nicotiana tabacum]
MVSFIPGNLSLKGSDNPKDKNYKPPVSAPTDQSEEPVAVEPSTKPASTVDDMPPGPSTTAGPSTSAGPGIPSSWESVKEIRAYVDRLKADQLPLDLLLEDPAPAAVPAAEPLQEQTQRLPKKKRKLPSADEVIIQLADPPEASSSQPQDVPEIQPVQVQAPVPAAEQQETGNQSEIPAHTKDPGTTDDPM